MAQTLKATIQKYADSKQSKAAFEYLKILDRFLQGKADQFLASRQRPKYDKGLIISDIKFQNHLAIATNDHENTFQKMIKDDFDTRLHPQFTQGFAEVIERRISFLRKRKESKQFRGKLITISRDSQWGQSIKSKHHTCLQKPIVLRLDYQIIYQRIEHPDLSDSKEGVREVILLSYTLSSIMKEFFSEKEVTYYINEEYDSLNQPLFKVNSQSLLKVMLTSNLFAIKKKKNLIYENFDKDKLLYDSKASKYNLPFLKRIGLILIYSRWQNGLACFGTGFYFDHKVALTSSNNVMKFQKYSISEVQICLNPQDNQRTWIKIDKTKIKLIQQSEAALIILPYTSQTKKRLTLKTEDPSKHFSRSLTPSNLSYVYGFRFEKKEDTIIFYADLSIAIVKDKPWFDSFYYIRSKVSTGGLVFYTYDDEPILFGLYNPFNKGVFNFSLIHGELSEQIYKAIERKQILIENHSLIGDDDRQGVKINELKNKPYSAIGMVYCKIQMFDKKNIFLGDKGERGDGVQGTGTFISPNVILTCAHNVLEYKGTGSKQRTIIAKEVYFYPGFTKQKEENTLYQVIQGNYYHYTIPIDCIYVPNQYLQSYNTNQESRLTSDIAVLYLKNGSHTSHLQIKSVTQGESQYWKKTDLKLCGYPGQSLGTLKEAQGKAIYDTKQVEKDNPSFKKLLKMVYYQIDATQGNSGTAVMAKQGDDFNIVAVHTLGYSKQLAGNKVGFVNSGVLLVEENLQFVKQKLQQLSGQKKVLGNSLRDFYRKL